MNRIGSGLVVAFLATSSLAAVHSVEAQSNLLPDTPRQGLWMEAVHPNTKQFDVTVPSTAWFVSGRYPVTARLRGVADVPFAFGDLDASTSATQGKSVIGNPYLGIEYQAYDRVVLELGARAPVTSADEDSFGDVVGFLADPLRGEAFLQDVVPVTGAVNVMHDMSGFSVRARGGVTQAFYSGSGDADDVTFLDYGIVGMYPVNSARIAVGMSGRWDASADEGDFSENSMHHLGLSADVLVRGIRPGVLLRVPVNESYQDLVRSSVGFYLQVPLPLR